MKLSRNYSLLMAQLVDFRGPVNVMRQLDDTAGGVASGHTHSLSQ